MRKSIQWMVCATLWLLICVALRVPVNAFEYMTSYLYGGTNDQYINYVRNANGALDSVSPDYFKINADGRLSVEKIDRYFISLMHDQHVQVIPFVSNHWDRKIGQAALDNADALAAEIARAVYDYNLDGVNIDIENIDDNHKDAYSYFVTALRHMIPGRVLSVSVAANPHGIRNGWEGGYDYKRLAENSDYLLVMAYDEHYYGSRPGPVASAAFTEKAIEYALKYTTPDKIVLGIPFYGRFWKEGDEIGGHGLTVMDINNLSERYENRKIFDDETQSAQITLTISTGDTQPKVWGGRTLEPGIYNIWYDDMQAMQYKLELAKRFHLRGTGSWALGQDTRGMWDAYTQYKERRIVPTWTDSQPENVRDTGIDLISQAPRQTTEQQLTPQQLTPQTNTIVASTATSPRRFIPSSTQTSGNTPTQTRARASAQLTPSVGPQSSNSVNTQGLEGQGTTGNKQFPAQTYGGASASNGNTSSPRSNSGVNSASSGVPTGTYSNNAGISTGYSNNVGSPTGMYSNNIGSQTGVFSGTPYNRTASSSNSPVHDTTNSLSANNFSAETRRVIDRGWMSAKGYDENRYATHEDVVALVTRMVSSQPNQTDAHKQSDQTLTRQDLALFLDNVFDLPDTINFEHGLAKDLQRERNAERYYAAQKYIAHGVMETDDNGYFYPDRAVTMGELTRIADRLSGTRVKNLSRQESRIIEPR